MKNFLNAVMKLSKSYLRVITMLGLFTCVFASSHTFAAWGKKDAPAKANVQQQTQAKINVNKADAKTLSSLLAGVGLSKAEAIVKYRKQHGNFSTLEDLTKVKGIGNAIVAKNKARITF